MDLDDLPSLKDVIAAHDLQPTKKLGQNFLLDQNVTDKIVRNAGDLAGHTVFEIGPGPGGLTRSLLRADAGKVIAVEFDSRSVAALQGLKEAAAGRLDVIEADALTVDLMGLAEAPRAIVANLPYNVATPLLIGWLGQLRADVSAFDHMTLMFQKEVADRIVAQPGGKAYGRLSVLCQWLCEARLVYVLPPSAFTPPPKVMSAVVHFRPKDLDDCAVEMKRLEAVTAAAFGQRRKMIRSSLKAYLPAIEALGLDPTLRAENLSVADFVAIAAHHST